MDRHTIETDCSPPFEVFLSDEMVDLDKPVKIKRDEDVLWEGTAERRLDFTLNHIKETGDRGRVFAASVVVE